MRKITSLILFISGIIELITSVVLYIIPAGRVAYWADYHFMGLSKHQWGNIHITVGALLLLAAGLHIYYNWRPITAYLKNKAKQLTVFNKNFNIALIISAYVAGGTLYSLPPMNYVLGFGEYLSELGNEKYGEPPYGHAELSSLEMFCDKMNINTADAIELLENAGMNFSSMENSMATIARNNRRTPQQVYDIIKPAGYTPKEDQAFPDRPSPGFGTKTIEDICQAYDLPLEDVMTKLRNAGFDANADDSVKEIGAKNKSNPMVIFEMMKAVAGKDK